MNPDLEVDTDDLRQFATSTDEAAARVTGAAAADPVPPPTPRWATTGAAGLAATAARHQLGLLGGDVTETAHRIRAAAEAYQEADARAAARLRSAR